MRVALAGSTGFIGRHLKNYLSAEGFEVIDIPHEGDRLLLGQEHEGVDAVINLSGASIRGRWSLKRQQQIVSSREGSAKQINHFYDGLAQKPQVLLSASGIGYYGDCPDQVVIESSAKGSGFLADVVARWEQATFDSPIKRCVVFRLGVVLGHDGGVLALLKRLVYGGVGAILGSKNTCFCWVHIQDVLRAFVFALQRGSVKGVYNLTAPESSTQQELMEGIGELCQRKVRWHVPAWLLKLILGEASCVILNQIKAYPKNLKLNGFEFLYPDLSTALASLKRK